MSRVSRYQTSFERFIKDRDCYSDLSYVHTESIKKLYIDNECIIPILTLTIMGSRKKKNNLSYQVYYAATASDFIRIAFEDLKRDNIKGLGQSCISSAVKYWNMNINGIKKKIESEKIIRMNGLFMDNIFKKIIDMMSDNTIKEYKNQNFTDIHRNFLKNESLDTLEKFKKLKALNEDTIDKITKNGDCKVIEIAMMIGWFIGCGSEMQSLKLQPLAEDFGFMYKISKDFKNIKTDILNIKDNYTENYVLNMGLQQSFEEFNTRKDRFIESAITIDILTPTMSEIINILETVIENAIDSTSPDLKSSYSLIA